MRQEAQEGTQEAQRQARREEARGWQVSTPTRTRARTAKHKETATVTSLRRIANTLKLTATCMLLAGLGLLFIGAPGAFASGPAFTLHVSHSPATFHRGELAPIV